MQIRAAKLVVFLPGYTAPAMCSALTFDTLALKPELLGNLGVLGYQEMTLVQARTLPQILHGADVLARAKTGSGKTAAFALGVLNKLDAKSFQVQALVLCPTRELADQVSNEIRRLGRGIGNIKVLSLCGGVPIGPQLGSLQHGAHIVVGTPGRVLQHLNKKSLRLHGLTTLVLDEADRMLDMGFTEEIDATLAFVPGKRQTLLFSATFADGMVEVSARVQRNPVYVDVTEQEAPPQITQYWCEVARADRNRQLANALNAWGTARNLVFCNTKIDCAELAGYLRAQGMSTLALHGDLDQNERSQALVRFSNGSANVLIATDVAARGLDIDDVDVVFNYELPPQAEVYLHRIGRTARAGKQGVAVSLVAPRELTRLHAIEELLASGELQSRAIPESAEAASVLTAAVTTIEVNGGRKDKLRPGDLLGALTAAGGVPGAAVGKIHLFDNNGYLAINNAHLSLALNQLNKRKIKGRQFRARAVNV